ncbi:hypothetical protein NDI39_29615 [Microcoleus sp. ZQ-A2]
MDSQELERLVRQPQESAKLDFKIEPYKIYEPKPTVSVEVQKWADAKEQQWAELVKDVLAVTNGSRGRVGGRRPKLSPQQCQEIIEMVTSERKSSFEAARLFNVHPSTVSRLLARHRRTEIP